MMNSEISTDSQSFQPWQLFTLAGLVGATIAVFFAHGQAPAVVILLSLTVLAAAAVGVATLRTVAPLTGRGRVEAAAVLGGRTRAALEREKTLVLRSIKELEFDRAMKKVSDKDFNDMSMRLRARAARLLRQLDAGSIYRGDIEREVARRAGTPLGATAAFEVKAPDTCASCGTANDADARFCKSCGTTIGEAS